MSWKILGQAVAVPSAEASASSIVDLLLYASGWRYGQQALCGMITPTRMGVGMAFGGNLVPVTYLRELMIRQGANFSEE
jgi:hypothetical protein